MDLESSFLRPCAVKKIVRFLGLACCISNPNLFNLPWGTQTRPTGRGEAQAFLYWVSVLARRLYAPSGRWEMNFGVGGRVRRTWCTRVNVYTLGFDAYLSYRVVCFLRVPLQALVVGTEASKHCKVMKHSTPLLHKQRV